MWVRGLKRELSSLHLLHGCRTLCGCVDWNFACIGIVIIGIGRTLCGCVDWNDWYIIIQSIKVSRTLCGCVDWNVLIIWICNVLVVAPYVGAWIETGRIERQSTARDSRTLCGCVDWNNCFRLTDITTTSHPMWVRGLKLIHLSSRNSDAKSHPMWVRGLKRCILSDGSKHFEGVPSWNWNATTITFMV